MERPGSSERWAGTLVKRHHPITERTKRSVPNIHWVEAFWDGENGWDGWDGGARPGCIALLTCIESPFGSTHFGIGRLVGDVGTIGGTDEDTLALLGFISGRHVRRWM
jgi:hypothetical protein